MCVVCLFVRTGWGVRMAEHWLGFLCLHSRPCLRSDGDNDSFEDEIVIFSHPICTSSDITPQETPGMSLLEGGEAPLAPINAF